MGPATRQRARQHLAMLLNPLARNRPDESLARAQVAGAARVQILTCACRLHASS